MTGKNYSYHKMTGKNFSYHKRAGKNCSYHNRPAENTNFKRTTKKNRAVKRRQLQARGIIASSIRGILDPPQGVEEVSGPRFPIPEKLLTCFPPDVEESLLKHLILNDVKALRATSKTLRSSRILTRIQNQDKERAKAHDAYEKIYELYRYFDFPFVAVARREEYKRKVEALFARVSPEVLELARQKTSEDDWRAICSDTVKDQWQKARQWVGSLLRLPYIRTCECVCNDSKCPLAEGCPKASYSSIESEVRYCARPGCGKAICYYDSVWWSDKYVQGHVGKVWTCLNQDTGFECELGSKALTHFSFYYDH